MAPSGIDVAGKIARVAFSEFVAASFDTAKISTIAARASVAKGTVFLHFRNKHDLFQDCMLKKISEIAAIINAPPSGVTKRKFATLSLNRDFPGLIRLALAEEKRFPLLARKIYENLFCPVISQTSSGRAAEVYESKPSLLLLVTLVGSALFVQRPLRAKVVKSYLGLLERM